MIRAAGTRKDGKPLFIFGLEQENVRRLQNDEPILVNLRDMGHPDDVWVALIAGEDNDRLVAAVQRTARIHR